MSKKSIILSIFIAASILISGCILDTNNGTKGNETKTIKSDIIPTINLPTGFTYMAVHETNIDNGNFSHKAIEGVYRTEQGEDIYVQVFETDKPEELLKEYKAQYNNEDSNPFTDIYFNGHKATKIVSYFTSDGKSVPKYMIVWIINNSMIRVGSSTDAQKVINLATATNS